MSSWFIPYYFAEKDSLYVMFFKEMFERKKKTCEKFSRAVWLYHRAHIASFVKLKLKDFPK